MPSHSVHILLTFIFYAYIFQNFLNNVSPKYYVRDLSIEFTPFCYYDDELIYLEFFRQTVTLLNLL